jgi:hypothetical protein
MDFRELSCLPIPLENPVNLNSRNTFIMQKDNIGNGLLGLSLFLGVPSLALCMGRSDASGLFVLALAATLALAGSYWPSYLK